MEGKRRRKTRGRGSTVQQLFTEVLSSYFTRKHSHSYLNSPTGQSPTPSASHSCRCLLHFLPFILTLWMELPPEPPSLSPPICWFLSQREQMLDTCLNENDIFFWNIIIFNKTLRHVLALSSGISWSNKHRQQKVLMGQNFLFYLSVLHGIIMICVNT